ncbi:MAG: PA14 domain-containing protein [Candidatus Bathyarchaeota archaeon]|nr:PA14 domain-containing protein [Candidatus Bathyarchaeota archaeon]MDH5745599.1 PA14 domain-containing protein [Candidatus Bathyarchaeota archaeon]
MSEGISRTTFVVGLIIAILVSSLISIFVTMQWARGPKGDKGDKGDQGLQGPQGEQGPPVAFAEWDVHWRTLTGDLEWGAVIGTSVFCSTFDYNWGTGTIFLGYDDYVGFEAYMQVKMRRDGPFTFEIGSDDGARFYIDDILKLDNWSQGSYRTKSALIYLTQGFHTLKIRYYEVGGPSRVSFYCDSDILMWYE